MSLLTSLYTGASGLSASSLDLSVIGDNIANSNTIGFKETRATFEDALSRSLIGDAGQEGLGVQAEAVRGLFTQGSLASTGVATDLALQGDGFFVVKGAHQGEQGSYYTRAGQFSIDKDGYLVNLEGLRVQGFSADAAGAVSGAPGDLLIGQANDPPRATNTLTIKGNLDKTATAFPASNPWDPTNPDATSNFSTSSVVYDGAGTAHDVQVYFRKDGDGAWSWHAMTDGSGIAGGTAGTKTEIASGTLTYDSTGHLTNQTQTSNFVPVGATTAQPLTINLGDPTSTGGTGLAGMTQFAGSSATTFLGNDGAAAGQLTSLQVETDGNVVGTFTNGETRTLGQVAVATFSAPDQLSRVGGNLFARTPLAGDPSVGGAGTGGRGTIASGSLEQSNVDIASEFIHMISAQRAFQANARTVTTADSLLQELIQLKR
jgi:flagellar hook protein FlgE